MIIAAKSCDVAEPNGILVWKLTNSKPTQPPVTNPQKEPADSRERLKTALLIALGFAQCCIIAALVVYILRNYNVSTS